MQEPWTPLYPVYIYHEGVELPKDGTYFVVAGNGIWMRKQTGICSCFVPVTQISFLDDLEAEEELKVDLPKLPLKFVWKIKRFFEIIVNKYMAESEVTLYYNKSKNDYKIHVPKQSVTHGGVRYQRSGTIHIDDMDGYLRVGTIHSHCDFGAFHSGTDIGDEEDFDGVHITFGNNNKKEFTITASVVVNAKRIQIDPLQYLEGIIATSNSHFGFEDISEELKTEWSAGLDEWVSQVNQFGSNIESDLQKGDYVDFANTQTFKVFCGVGPYEVLKVSGDLLTINTKAGITEFSRKLFQKVQ